LAVAVLAAGCGDDEDAPAQAQPQREGQVEEREDPRPSEELSIEPASCPPELAGCRTASGRIVYVERVDPDGDGDAHFVLASRQSITFPGISVIDVPKDLRPHPLPGRGDELSAAGQVFRGSYGQRQIHAVDLRVGR
jgi:hypothetical protein